MSLGNYVVMFVAIDGQLLADVIACFLVILLAKVARAGALYIDSCLFLMITLYYLSTVDPISSIARIAKAGVSPVCVSALRILMTVVLIPLTFINICMGGTECEKL